MLAQGRQKRRSWWRNGSEAEREEGGTLGFSLPSRLHVSLRVDRESEMTEAVEISVRETLRADWRLPGMVQEGDSDEGRHFSPVFFLKMRKI